MALYKSVIIIIIIIIVRTLADVMTNQASVD